MRRIHFDNRSITICKPDEPLLDDPNAVIAHCCTEKELMTIPLEFDNAKHIQKLFIPTNDIEDVFSLLCGQFHEVTAAGGLVMNRAHDFLLIFRNDLWDLPKGKLEEGEKIEECAMREVREETGLDDLQLDSFICITHHVYHMYGAFNLKHTYWYNMHYGKHFTLTPQLEEDIFKAAWVSRKVLPEYLYGTYPSITEVFKKARIL